MAIRLSPAEAARLGIAPVKSGKRGMNKTTRLVNWEAWGIPIPDAERLFSLPRRWRFDYCWTISMLALEVEGGVWKKGGGRHNRGSGFMKDVEKYNRAAVIGYRLLRCTPQQLESGEIMATIRQALRLNELVKANGSGWTTEIIE